MNELPISQVGLASREMHSAQAVYSHRVCLIENFEGSLVWEGTVLVFDLVGYPTASRCYAWEVTAR